MATFSLKANLSFLPRVVQAFEIVARYAEVRDGFGNRRTLCLISEKVEAFIQMHDFFLTLHGMGSRRLRFYRYWFCGLVPVWSLSEHFPLTLCCFICEPWGRDEVFSRLTSPKNLEVLFLLPSLPPHFSPFSFPPLPPRLLSICCEPGPGS